MSELLDENLEPEAPAVVEEATQGAPEPAAAAPEPQTTEIDWNEATLNEAAARIAAMGYTIAPAVQQPQAEEPQTQEPEFDPFDPESVKAWNQAQLDAQREQILAEVAPVREFVAQQQAQAEEAYLKSEVAKAREEIGYTPPGEDPAVRDQQIALMTRINFQQRVAALPPATSPFEAATRGAVTEQLAREALKEAVQFWADHDKQVGEAALASYFNKLQEDGSHILDPGIRGAALSTERQPARSEMEVAARFAERRRATAI